MELQAQGTKDAREFDEVHRWVVRSGDSVEWTRAKPIEQLQLSLVSALLTGNKVPKVPKPEKIVPTVNRYRRRKGIRKDIGQVWIERQLRERMLFATPLSAKPEQAWQIQTSKYNEVCINDKLLAGPDLLHGSNFQMSTSASSRTGYKLLEGLMGSKN